MDRFTTLTSRVVPLRVDNIDTDQIIPARFLKVVDTQGLADNLFADWRQDPDFILNRPEARGARILLAGDNFGCGSSREHAPWALAGWGFAAVIATSFADIFRGNALKNGLLPVVLPASVVETLFEARRADPELTITVDLERERVSMPWGGCERSELGGDGVGFAVERFARHCLLAGVDQLGYLLDLDGRIAGFELEHEDRGRARDRAELAACSRAPRAETPTRAIRSSRSTVRGARTRIPVEARIAVLPGDGIGPEVVAEALRVLEQVAACFGHSFRFEEHPLGGAAIDGTGQPLPEATLVACRAADAVLLGAVGGPRWDDPRARVRPEQGLLALRRELGLYANLRPVRVLPALARLSPLKPERLAGVDLVVVRELTGGLYFGRPQLREVRDGVTRAVDTLEYRDYEIRRVVERACRLARGRRGLVTSVDKANVLESSRLWRQVATEVAAEHPQVTIEHQLVDSAAMRLVSRPASFDVLVTENMFGDILTDEAGVLCGSLGLLPSASLGDGSRGLYEPIHGSAPDIAGKGVANPLGTILSAAMLLRHSLGLDVEARAVEQAVEQVIATGAGTPDLGGRSSTREVGQQVVDRIRVLAPQTAPLEDRIGAPAASQSEPAGSLGAHGGHCVDALEPPSNFFGEVGLWLDPPPVSRG